MRYLPDLARCARSGRSPSSRGQGRRPFTAATRVQIPLGTHDKVGTIRSQLCSFVFYVFEPFRRKVFDRQFTEGEQ